MSNAFPSARQPLAYDLKARYAVSRAVAALARELPVPLADWFRCGEEIVVALDLEPAEPGFGATLRQIRAALFTAPGHEADMTAEWHESLATAAFAGAFARQRGLEGPDAAVAGLLHRAGDVGALRALSLAESASGVRLEPRARGQIARQHAPAFLEALVRGWRLAPQVAVALQGWNRFGEFPTDTLATAVYLGDLLAHEFIRPGSAVPTVLESTCGELGVSVRDLDALRGHATAIQALVGRCG